MKVLLSVPLIPFTGYGKDGVALVDLFLRMGCDVYLDPDGVQPPISPQIAALLTKNPPKTTDLQLKQFDPSRLKSSAAERKYTGMLHGWTMWEWDHLDARLNDDTIGRIFNYTEFFHSVAMYDEVSARAVQEHLHPNVLPIVAQGGFDANAIKPVQRDWTARPFKFVMYGALTPRKGPFYAIEAFELLRQRRPDLDIELHLKTSDVGLHPDLPKAHPGLFVYNEIWTEQQLKGWLAETHCLLCPSLGEGKNMAALEYLASGGCVIATAWGGHMVWLSDQYAFPLKYKEVLEAPLRHARRAEPDIEHLTELMEFVVDNPYVTQARADCAKRLVPQMFSWETTVANMFERLANDPRCVTQDVCREVVNRIRTLEDRR